MTTEKTYWNKENCLQFLRSFAPFEHKYLKVFNSSTTLSALDRSKLNRFNQLLDSQLHGRSSHSLSTNESVYAAQGIKQVYNDSFNYNDAYLEMIDLVRDKFIYEYTGIPGLCDFFSPRYFEFEWGMHLEINYEKGDSRYYRDHYVHQIRNLYEMFSMLDDFDYYDKCKETYCNPENEIGTFIFDCINRELLTLNYVDGELYGKMLCINGKAKCNSSCFVNCIKNVSQHRREMSEIMFHYVIYSASIIASLLHDIGYPITYLRRVGVTMNKNLPFNRLFASFTSDFDEIKATLHDSLLFSIVKDSSKIETRLRKEDGEHGVYSAILLLLYFRQNGTNLTTLQRCAIELAALVIYNHTNIYEVCKPKDPCELRRSDFYKEPLSHLFRLCDDLQEWDRVYFEITDKSNIFICNKCKTPVLRKFGTDNKPPYEKVYSCCCGNSNEKVEMYDTSPFVNRRIINVIGCTEVGVSKLEVKRSDEDSCTTFPLYDMTFDCNALLNAMPFSTSFGKVRAAGIRDLKRRCSYQGSADTVLVDFFASSNPVVVKVKILERYLKDVIGSDTIDNISPSSSSVLSKLQLTDFSKSACDYVKSAFEKSLDFYSKLLLIGNSLKECGANIVDIFLEKTDLHGYDDKAELLNTSNVKVLESYSRLYETVVKKIRECIHSDFNDCKPVSSTITTCWTEIKKDLDNDFIALCEDYFLQQIHLSCYDKVKESLEFSSANDTDTVFKNNLYRQFYENLYCSDASLASHIESHVSREKYDKIKDGSRSDTKFHHNFYVDYGLFIYLWDKVLNRCSHSYFDSDNAKPYLKINDDSFILPHFNGDDRSCFSHGVYTLKIAKAPGGGSTDELFTVNVRGKSDRSSCLENPPDAFDISDILKALELLFEFHYIP